MFNLAFAELYIIQSNPICMPKQRTFCMCLSWCPPRHPRSAHDCPCFNILCHLFTSWGCSLSSGIFFVAEIGLDYSNFGSLRTAPLWGFGVVLVEKWLVWVNSDSSAIHSWGWEFKVIFLSWVHWLVSGQRDGHRDLSAWTSLTWTIFHIHGCVPIGLYTCNFRCGRRRDFSCELCSKTKAIKHYCEPNKLFFVQFCFNPHQGKWDVV